MFSSLVHRVRPDDGLIEKKGPKHVVHLLTPYTVTKFCCVLTYPPYINCDIEELTVLTQEGTDILFVALSPALESTEQLTRGEPTVLSQRFFTLGV